MSSARRPRTPQLAERLFEATCLAAGLTSNASHDDQFGWDALVQFPSLRLGGPADLDPVGATCLVQVKSNRSGRKDVRLKLSNALRFAREAVPCFLVLLTFDDEGTELTGAYLHHVWKDDIAAAMRAAREAYVENDADLHRRGFTVRFAAAERCDLSEIPQRIEAAVNEVGGDYSAAKSKFAATIGYENGYAKGTFTFEEGVSDEDFVDLMLGRLSDLPVSRISMQENRFGLPGPTVIPDMPGKLSIAPAPTEPCQVVIGPASGAGEMSLEGQLYVPGVPLSDSLFKLRVQTSVVEIVLRPNGESNLNLQYDFDEELDIASLVDKAQLLGWVYGGAVNVAFWLRGAQLGHGTIEITPKAPSHPWLRLAAATSKLLTFMPARRWPAEARFKIRDVMEGVAIIELFAGQVSDAGVKIFLSGTTSTFLDRADSLKRYLAPQYLDFEKATLFAVVEAPIERISAEGDGHAILLGSPRPLRRAVLPGSAKANLAFMQAQLAEVVAERGDGQDLVRGTLGDIEALGPDEPVA